MARIDPEIKRRAAELIGLGASWEEAARATKISSSTVGEMMRDPQWRAVRDAAAASKGSGLVKDALDVLRDAVKAETHDEEPNFLVRSKAAESILKNAEVIERMEGLSEEDEELRGVIHVYPGQGLLCPHCGKPLEEHPPEG